MIPFDRPIRIGTRGSELARAQTQFVAAALIAAWPELAWEEVVISTRGDREIDRPFAAVGSRGIFARDIEAELLDGNIDLAVHSLKDLESALPDGLTIAAVLPRADARDALVAMRGGSLADLPRAARVATSSIRRAALLRHARPDLRIEPIRGNVPTRLRKAQMLRLDALVLACAGLDRLGLSAAITERLDPAWFVPEACQGVIAIEARQGGGLAGVLAAISDGETAACAVAERACVRTLEGSCRTPIAAHAALQAGELRLSALVCSADGQRLLHRTATGPRAQAEDLGRAVADELLSAGAAALLAGDARPPGAEAPGYVHKGR